MHLAAIWFGTALTAAYWARVTGAIDLSQVAIWLGLSTACYFGRREPRIVAVMAGNFAATVTLAAWPLPVAVADLLSAAVLCFGSVRAKVVAAFFVAMAAIYPIGYAAQMANATIYAIVDVLAFLQFVAVGRGDDGIDACRRYLGRLRHRGGLSVVRGTEAAPNMGMASSQVRRGQG